MKDELGEEPPRGFAHSFEGPDRDKRRLDAINKLPRDPYAEP